MASHASWMAALALMGALAGCQRSGDPACLQEAERWKIRQRADLAAQTMKALAIHDILSYSKLAGQSNQDCSGPGGICVERPPKDAAQAKAFQARAAAVEQNDSKVAKFLGEGYEQKAWRAALDKSMDDAEKAQADLESLDDKYMDRVGACIKK